MGDGQFHDLGQMQETNAIGGENRGYQSESSPMALSIWGSAMRGKSVIDAIGLPASERCTCS
jgi:hypothetical protein